MTTVLSPYSSVGFYQAPVTKSILGGLFITSCAFHVPQLAHLRQYLVCSINDIFDSYGIFKFVICRCAVLDIKDLVCGALLFYYFRVFEKRCGSHKFCSKLMITWLASLSLELFMLNIMYQLDFASIYGPSKQIISGPFGLIFPLFINYFFDIPRVTQTHILGVPITGKTLTYCIGLQMISSSISSAISGVCGLLAGLAYRYNVAYIETFRIPNVICKFFGATFGRLIASSPPHESIFPMGATLEIQRSQQLEMLEQQMMLNRSRESRAFSRIYGFPNGYQDINHENELIRRHRGDNSVDRGHNIETSRENVIINENQVQTLVEMGFERERVITALQNSGNDLQMATMLLLQDT